MAGIVSQPRTQRPQVLLRKLEDSGEITEQQLEQLMKTVLDTYANL